MSININPDTTSVTISGTTNTVTVVDTPNNVNVSTTQPVTSTVTIAIPGPQGPAGGGANINTGSFATTGSNGFIGNQSIQGDLLISGSNNVNSALFFLSGASVATIGSNIDMTAGPGGWSEIGSNNGQNYVWVDDSGLNLVTSWDGNTQTSAWRIATGSRQLIAVGDLDMNGRSITGSLVGTASYALYAETTNTVADFTFTSQTITNGGITLHATSDDIVLNADGNVYIGSANSGNGIVTDGYLGLIIGDSNIINTSTGHSITDVISNVSSSIPSVSSLNAATSSYATTGSNTFIGNQTITGSVKISGSITGSLFGTASFAASASYIQGYVLNTSTSSFVTNSQTSSFVLNSNTSSFVINSQTGSFATTGSATFTGPQIVTGSTRGNVTALSITSNTASLNLSTGNFFTLQLVQGTNTFINPSNILPGQTSILTLSTTGSATVSFPSSVKQPSGSAYIPTTSTGVDILTFVSVDSSTLYVANIKNMI